MKIYKFYQKPTEKERSCYDDNTPIHHKYPLYAFTNNKEYCLEFTNQRDMNQFIFIQTKVTKEEFVDYANTNRTQMLDMYEYSHHGSYVSKKRIRQNSEKVTILSTWNEKETCEQGLDDGMISFEEYVQYSAIPYLFKKKYLNALNKLEYTSFWKLMGNSERYEDIIDESDMDYSAPNVIYDEFEIFLNLFGYTFK